jgi:hypothetical protein
MLLGRRLAAWDCGDEISGVLLADHGGEGGLVVDHECVSAGGVYVYV